MTVPPGKGRVTDTTALNLIQASISALDVPERQLILLLVLGAGATGLAEAELQARLPPRMLPAVTKKHLMALQHADFLASTPGQGSEGADLRFTLTATGQRWLRFTGLEEKAESFAVLLDRQVRAKRVT